ncbi:MAG: hypothetical protein IRZ08_12205, partial [Frankia sp.]|nr:hypothetical protein [Frankia sp.]
MSERTPAGEVTAGLPGPAVTAPAGPALLEPAAVRLAETATDRDHAIRQ